MGIIVVVIVVVKKKEYIRTKIIKKKECYRNVQERKDRQMIKYIQIIYNNDVDRSLIRVAVIIKEKEMIEDECLP